MSWTRTASRFTLILRRLRGRFGIFAPQVSVRSHIPWYFRVVAAVGAILVSFGLAIWAFDTGRRQAGYDHNEVAQLLEKADVENRVLQEEVARLNGLLAASEGKLQIEQAAQKLLTDKNSLLSKENDELKEQLAVFERISRLEGKSGDEVSLDQLIIRYEPEGLYRYSFLIALQGARRGKEGRFALQILVTPRQGSRDAMILFEGKERDVSGQYEINLRNFRKIDGVFRLPKDYPLAGVEVRVMESGKLKATRRISVEDLVNVQ